MNLFNALGFFVLGLAMEVLPELTPVAAVPAGSSFGDATALWLEFMGAVIFLIGSGYTAKSLAAALPKSTREITAPAAVPARSRETLPADGKQATV
ncbi:MAG TPA: hypothetical protein VMI53_06230 [Opitutaceae bacterium]|nr:hypothetical protein [Opitutaceae bacterium]